MRADLGWSLAQAGATLVWAAALCARQVEVP
jgi:hypothetical protein